MARRGSIILRWTMSLVILVGAVWVLLNRQMVVDQFTVWQYQPSSEIAALAHRADFSETAKFTFYASRPELNNKQDFNKHCRSHQEEGSVVLGCYTAQHIYVYNVQDERLDGVKEVTAAHEMLHAAYERLPEKERTWVNGLIEKERQRNTDPRLLERIKLYDRIEPGQRLNELHSIFGTETTSLSPELERYYTKYFDDRSAVTALFKKYETVFLQLETQQKQLVAELEAMGTELKTRTQTFNDSIAQLNVEIQSFNARADTEGGFSSQNSFNAARADLLVRQQALEAEQASLNRRIDVYNQKRKDLEAINLRAKDLQNSLNSSPAPVPSL
jgi:hypothetical protein